MARRDSQRRAVKKHRRRLRRRGLVRLEVQVPAGDALLVRRVAGALRGEPEAATALRARVRGALASGERLGLKALLASAPLDGIDLVPRSDLPRDLFF